MRRRWSLGHNWGRTTSAFLRQPLRGGGPLREWEEAYPTPGEHTKQVPPSMCLTDSTSITRSRRCCVEGTSDALEKWCDVSPTDRGRTGGNVAYLRSMAVLSEFGGDTQGR